MKLQTLHDKKEKSYFILATKLQQIIGYLGIALPIIVYLFIVIAHQYFEPLPTISHYYYTRSGVLFSMIVAVIALFLIFYKGDIDNKRTDDWITTVAAICALGIIIFPTDNLDTSDKPHLQEVIITSVNDSGLRENIHLFLAALFFVCLAYILFYRFPKIEEKELAQLNQSIDGNLKIESKNLKEEKEKLIKRHKRRNMIFRVSAFLLIFILVIIALTFFLERKEIWQTYTQFYASIWGTFFLESIMILIFGISWLTKGSDYFGDITKEIDEEVKP